MTDVIQCFRAFPASRPDKIMHFAAAALLICQLSITLSASVFK